MMPRIILLLVASHFLFSLGYAQVGNQYWLESSGLDSLMLGNFTTYRKITGWNDNSIFNFSITSKNDIYLKLYSKTCDKGVSFTLWGKKENGYTSWIYLEPGDSISIQECFEKYPEKSWVKEWSISAKEKVVDFIRSMKSTWDSNGRSGRIDCSRISRYKGGEDPNPEDPKLEFLESNHYRFFDTQDLTIPFRLNKGYPIKSMFIIGQKGELVLCAGDSNYIAPAIKGPINKIAQVDQVLEECRYFNVEERCYTVKYENLQPYLLQVMSPGKRYQLGIELEIDESDFNPYVFNFQFYTPEEIKKFRAFAHD